MCNEQTNQQTDFANQLITKQAAIDWLTNEWDGMVTSAFDGIKNLPSAQPETHEEHTKTHACDLISRQDTVDVIASMIAYHKTLDDAYWYVKDDAPSAQPETCAYWDRESNYCALHRPSAQPESIKIHLDHELTKEERERLMQIGDSPVIPPDRQEITLESAIDYLHSIGWMQEHDEIMYKQGYKHGKSKGIKRGMAMARRKEAGND